MLKGFSTSGLLFVRAIVLVPGGLERRHVVSQVSGVPPSVPAGLAVPRPYSAPPAKLSCSGLVALGMTQLTIGIEDRDERIGRAHQARELREICRSHERTERVTKVSVPFLSTMTCVYEVPLMLTSNPISTAPLLVTALKSIMQVAGAVADEHCVFENSQASPCELFDGGELSRPKSTCVLLAEGIAAAQGNQKWQCHGEPAPAARLGKCH